MVKVVGVRFKNAGKIYHFDPGDLELTSGDMVVVETVRGLEFGEVIGEPLMISKDEIVAPLKKVVRKATPKDGARVIENRQKEKEAFETALAKIEAHKLPMKLVDVEYTFDNSKIIFFFTSDGRVDFRELVKDLAGVFKTRIELRQIGVRDEAKLVGGLGTCGRPLCCVTFLEDFQPVSIRMAKDQNLSLNPAKISGMCGRLMCCLRYEHEVYQELRKDMPAIGSRFITDEGTGKIVDLNVLLGTVSVRMDDGTIVNVNITPKKCGIACTSQKGEDLKACSKDESIQENQVHNGGLENTTKKVQGKEPTKPKGKSNRRNRKRRKPRKVNQSKTGKDGYSKARVAKQVKGKNETVKQRTLSSKDKDDSDNKTSKKRRRRRPRSSSTAKQKQRNVPETKKKPIKVRKG